MDQGHLEVMTTYGAVKGSKVNSVEGTDYFCFLGIPFAEPPIGELRFKDPVAPKAWTGVRDATREGSKAHQVDFITNQMVGTEDCLYLNVSIRNLVKNGGNVEKKRAVMVWIHGGSFQAGSGDRDLYSPDYFMNHDIVFVSINYRLGMLGFLNLDLKECSGNQGLKDQVAALQWVRDNIAAFGGDPGNVTIFGESAGGASVHALCISSSAKGLFHKAIAQSGTMYSPWAYRRSNKNMAMKVAKVLGNEETDSKALLNFFKTKTPEELYESLDKAFPGSVSGMKIVFCPSFDGQSRTPFFSEDIFKTQKRVEVPFIFGHNSHEAIMFLDRPEGLKKLDSRFGEMLARDLYVDPEKVEKIAPEVRKFYFGDKKITDQESNEVVQFKSDVMFTNGINYTSDIQAAQSTTPVFFYRFSFLASVSLSKIMAAGKGQTPVVQGTSHADELNLLFFAQQFGDVFKLNENSKERLVMERFTRMWTDFAKTGNPTPQIDDLIPIKWPAFEGDKKNYLEINDELSVGVNPGKRAWRFWKPLYQEILSKL